MFSVTHFRSEFIHKDQATIIRKVTMTQFMLVIVLTAIGVGLFNAPFWLAPLFIAAGYTAGQYADAWVQASEIIQRAPGAQGTRLHRKIGDPNVLLAIARWDSKARRDSAESKRDPRVQAILDEQSVVYFSGAPPEIQS